MKCIKCFFLLLILLSLFKNLQAQIPVIEEPHHITVLKNDYVRLIDVYLKPHHTTMYHIHAKPSVVVFISKSLTGTQDMSGKGLPSGEVSPGQTLFADYEKDPVTHRVYNSGNNIFNVMDIELAKKNPSKDLCAALQQSNIETTINEKLVRVYKFDLNKHKSLNISKISCAHLLIRILGVINTTGKKLTTGEFVFFNPNTEISINNAENNNATCVLLQLK